MISDGVYGMTDGQHTQGHERDIMSQFEDPGEENLDAGQRELLAKTKTAFNELEKLTKNVALYGRSHPSVGRFRERFLETISVMLQELERIEFLIGPYEFTLFEHPVYQNPSPEDNFIYQLYLDGVRHISFERGLEQEELDRFVDILMTDWDDPTLFEDDMVTLMWTENFQHINYVVVDSFNEDIIAGDDHIYTVPGVIESVRAKSDPSALAPSREAQSMGGRSARIKALDLSSTSLTTGDVDGFSEQPFAMDEEEFVALKTMLTTTGRETLEKFIEILFKVQLTGDEDESTRHGRITGLFDQISALLLKTERVGELERLLRKIRRLTGPKGQRIPANVEAIALIFRHWSEMDFIERVTTQLGDPHYRFTPSVLAICGLLNSTAAPHLAQIASRASRPDVRQQIYDLVREKLPGQEREVSLLLGSASRGLAQELLRILSKQGTAAHLGYAVHQAMRNADGAVRLQALTVLPQGELQRHQDLLFNALDDGEKGVRSKAIHLLARVRTAQTHARIMKSMESKAFANYALDEKRRYYTAVALTGDACAFLLERFNASGGLLSRRANEQVRHCAAVALGVGLHRDAVPLFEKELKRRLKSDVVVEGVTWALNHLEGDREERTRQLYDILFANSLSSGRGGRPND